MRLPVFALEVEPVLLQAGLAKLQIRAAFAKTGRLNLKRFVEFCLFLLDLTRNDVQTSRRKT
jgi:hypothetical protein